MSDQTIQYLTYQHNTLSNQLSACTKTSDGQRLYLFRRSPVKRWFP